MELADTEAGRHRTKPLNLNLLDVISKYSSLTLLFH
jgi:hypothetical protein